MKEHIMNLEYQNRRDNLQFLGFAEQKGEKPGDTVREVLSKLGVDLDDRQIVRAHRLGRYDPNRTRPIIVRFAHWKDRDLVWQIRHELNQQSHIRVIEDLPKEMAAKRKILLPVMHAARFEKDENDMPKNKVSLVRDKLILNGEV